MFTPFFDCKTIQLRLLSVHHVASEPPERAHPHHPPQAEDRVRPLRQGVLQHQPAHARCAQGQFIVGRGGWGWWLKRIQKYKDGF